MLFSQVWLKLKLESVDVIRRIKRRAIGLFPKSGIAGWARHGRGISRGSAESPQFGFPGLCAGCVRIPSSPSHGLFPPDLFLSSCTAEKWVERARDIPPAYQVLHSTSNIKSSKSTLSSAIRRCSTLIWPMISDSSRQIF